MKPITMAEKARFYGYQAEKARAKAEAGRILLRLIKAAKAAYPVEHPKMRVAA